MSEQSDVKTLKEVSPKEFAAYINKVEQLDGGVPAKFVQMVEDANVWRIVPQDQMETHWSFR